MNGTALDQQIEIINELKELELTEPQSFCIMAQRNVDCMTYDGRNYYHPRKIDLLREKIKEGKFDEEAIEIAKIMYNDMIDRFSMKLSDQTNTYKKTVRREINRFRRRMRAIKFTQQLLQIIV